MASEMSFVNVDDGRTMDVCLYYKLTYEPAKKDMQERESEKRTKNPGPCILPLMPVYHILALLFKLSNYIESYIL